MGPPDRGMQCDSSGSRAWACRPVSPLQPCSGPSCLGSLLRVADVWPECRNWGWGRAFRNGRA
eukprot:2811835-Pyramimonas_sp.AAC.1